MYEETKRTYIEKETIVQVEAGPEVESGVDMFDALDLEAVKGEKDRLALDLANLQSKYDQLQKNNDNLKDDNNRFVMRLNQKQYFNTYTRFLKLSRASNFGAVLRCS